MPERISRQFCAPEPFYLKLMKPSLPFAFATLAAGFLLGWLVKPVPAPPDSPTQVRPAARVAPETRPPSPLPPGFSPPPETRTTQAPTPSATTNPPGEAMASPRDQAKLQRLAEALALSDTQQAELANLIQETRTRFAGPRENPMDASETLKHFEASGESLRKALDGLFTPEQAAKFSELRQRERSNRLDAKAQRELTRLASITDLSATQRDAILTRIRSEIDREMATIPAASALLLESTTLPLGALNMPEQSLLTLSKIASSGEAADPNAAHARMIEEQQRKLDAQREWLRPILTPAQLAQFEAARAEQRAFHDAMQAPPP